MTRLSAISMTVQPAWRWRVPRWLQRSVLFLLLGVAVLPLIGIICQTAATAIDQSRFQPPGHLVELDGAGGRRMHIYCQGQGSPTIVLDHAGGMPSLEWALVQSLLAQHTRVCAYDRAGFGWIATSLLVSAPANPTTPCAWPASWPPTWSSWIC